MRAVDLFYTSEAHAKWVLNDLKGKELKGFKTVSVVLLEKSEADFTDAIGRHVRRMFSSESEQPTN